ncbi:bifunctional DNA-formamidopyrimidine glycosylase/DNA-(apurinic or apyrimidinic site) lyase [Rhizobiaceae bacterium]|nr:bifunctional DNA-formamidopyrimidine glycosylase/DNA-(apurinic or apyrimidinic site) lyase [Rhizobiaceae bacterium]
MPELPEVETVRRGLAPAMEGATVDRLELRRADLRFPFPDGLADTMEGVRIAALGRRAKFLLMDFSPGDATGGEDVLILHLGMSGSFRLEGDANIVPGAFHHDRSTDPTHDHVVFHLTTAAGAPATVTYNDPRRFGFMRLATRATIAAHPHFAAMGVEPLGNELSAQHLATRLAGKRTPMKAALLDQSVIAGLGNIYVCEALWRAGISPRRSAGTLVSKSGAPTARLTRLVGHIRDVLVEAIEAGGSSLRDHAQADGQLGYFQHRFNAYDREGTPCAHEGCTGTISRIVQSGRSTFFCSACQR